MYNNYPILGFINMLRKNTEFVIWSLIGNLLFIETLVQSDESHQSLQSSYYSQVSNKRAGWNKRAARRLFLIIKVKKVA